MIILDTNVLSELMKTDPLAKVVTWTASQPSSSLFTTVVTEAKIRYGLALLPKGARKNALKQAIEGMFEEDLWAHSPLRRLRGTRLCWNSYRSPLTLPTDFTIRRTDSRYCPVADCSSRHSKQQRFRGLRYPGYQSLEPPLVKIYVVQLDLPDHSLYNAGRLWFKGISRLEKSVRP